MVFLIGTRDDFQKACKVGDLSQAWYLYHKNHIDVHKNEEILI